MTTIAIVALTELDAAAAGRLLAARHRDYPAFRHLFPGAAARATALRAFQTGAARDTARYGRGLLAQRDGQLVGVALWMPSGRFPPGMLRAARPGPALARVAVAAPGAFPAFARCGAVLARAIPAGPLWYLQALGVHPATPRTGVGAALLTAGLAAVDADALPCHLHLRPGEPGLLPAVGLHARPARDPRRVPAGRPTTG